MISPTDLREVTACVNMHLYDLQDEVTSNSLPNRQPRFNGETIYLNSRFIINLFEIFLVKGSVIHTYRRVSTLLQCFQDSIETGLYHSNKLFERNSRQEC